MMVKGGNRVAAEEEGDGGLHFAAPVLWLCGSAGARGMIGDGGTAIAVPILCRSNLKPKQVSHCVSLAT